MNAIEGIGGVIGQLAEISTSIAGAVEEQTATATEIARSVAEAANGTTDIVGRITRVAESDRSTADDAESAEHSAEGVAQLAQELAGGVVRSPTTTAPRGGGQPSGRLRPAAETTFTARASV